VRNWRRARVQRTCVFGLRQGRGNCDASACRQERPSAKSVGLPQCQQQFVTILPHLTILVHTESRGIGAIVGALPMAKVLLILISRCSCLFLCFDIFIRQCRFAFRHFRLETFNFATPGFAKRGCLSLPEGEQKTALVFGNIGKRFPLYSLAYRR